MLASGGSSQPAIQKIAEKEATIMLEAVRELAPKKVRNPLADATTLARAVQSGILDAPQLKNNPFAPGKIVTQIDDRGACIAIDSISEYPMGESKRIASLRQFT